MFTLNIYSRDSLNNCTYCFSITQTTRKQCLALADKKYSDMAWDWDDKNYIKNKKYNTVPNSAVFVGGLI
jgi:glutaredoxin